MNKKKLIMSIIGLFLKNVWAPNEHSSTTHFSLDPDVTRLARSVAIPIYEKIHDQVVLKNIANAIAVGKELHLNMPIPKITETTNMTEYNNTIKEHKQNDTTTASIHDALNFIPLNVPLIPALQREKQALMNLHDQNNAKINSLQQEADNLSNAANDLSRKHITKETLPREAIIERQKIASKLKNNDLDQYMLNNFVNPQLQHLTKNLDTIQKTANQLNNRPIPAPTLFQRIQQALSKTASKAKNALIGR